MRGNDGVLIENICLEWIVEKLVVVGVVGGSFLVGGEMVSLC